jgi:hypothetical protein
LKGIEKCVFSNKIGSNFFLKILVAQAGLVAELAWDDPTKLHSLKENHVKIIVALSI